MKLHELYIDGKKKCQSFARHGSENGRKSHILYTRDLTDCSKAKSVPTFFFCKEKCSKMKLHELYIDGKKKCQSFARHGSENGRKSHILYTRDFN